MSTPAEHYPCTRRLAAGIHALVTPAPPIQGVVWHSRQAELSGASPTEALVLYGDRYPASRGSWPLVGPGASSVDEGPGRLMVERIAEEVDATVSAGR